MPFTKTQEWSTIIVFLGLEFNHATGNYKIAPKTIAKLSESFDQVLNTGKNPSFGEILRLFGQLQWCALALRIHLARFYFVYKFLRRRGGSILIPSQYRRYRKTVGLSDSNTTAMVCSMPRYYGLHRTPSRTRKRPCVPFLGRMPFRSPLPRRQTRSLFRPIYVRRRYCSPQSTCSTLLYPPRACYSARQTDRQGIHSFR